MLKLKPTHQAGHQSLYRATVTININYGSFSFSRKAKEVMKLSKGSRFDIIENKGLFYIKPSETGAFILGEKNGTKGRLYTTDKGVSNLIKESYNVKSGSFMLHIGVNPVVVHSETNCFILNK